LLLGDIEARRTQRTIFGDWHRLRFGFRATWNAAARTNRDEEKRKNMVRNYGYKLWRNDILSNMTEKTGAHY
jgi:hypothetical protein